MGKNSKRNKNAMALTLKKDNIKNKTENTGFLAHVTKKADDILRAEKIAKR